MKPYGGTLKAMIMRAIRTSYGTDKYRTDLFNKEPTFEVVYCELQRQGIDMPSDKAVKSALNQLVSDGVLVKCIYRNQTCYMKPSKFADTSAQKESEGAVIEPSLDQVWSAIKDALEIKTFSAEGSEWVELDTISKCLLRQQGIYFNLDSLIQMEAYVEPKLAKLSHNRRVCVLSYKGKVGYRYLDQFNLD